MSFFERKIQLNLKATLIILFEIPVFIFFLFWCNIFIGVAASALLCAADYFVMKNKTNMIISMSVKRLAALFLIALFWCWLGGIGGFFYQYLDHNWRNAIFHDLINYDWPVIYDKIDKMLVYYIGVWLFPALIGKLAALIGLSSAASWVSANIVLLLYCAVCVTAVFCMLIKILKINKFENILICLIIFMLFSGMDVLGIILCGHNPFEFAIYEGWTGGKFLFEANSTGLFWSYNQHPFVWAAFLAILLDKDIKSLAFWGLLALPFGPLPFIGIFLFAVCAAFMIIKASEMTFFEFLKQVFSPQNIIAIATVGIIFLIYYLGNTISESISADSSIFMLSGATKDDVITYLIFILVEALPFFFFTFKENKKNPLMYLSLFMMLVFPLIRVGISMDFGMKTTIPALVYMYILIIKRIKGLKEDLINKKISARITAVLLCLMFAVGSFTSLIEPARGIYLCIQEKSIFLSCDTIRTLDNQELNTGNFTSDYHNAVFYEYISKK